MLAPRPASGLTLAILACVAWILSACLAPMPLPESNYDDSEYGAEAPGPIDLDDDGGFVVEEVDLEPLSDEALEEAEAQIAEDAAEADQGGASDTATLLRSLGDEELIVYALLLDAREAEGLPGLDLDARLVGAARAHSADMGAMGRCAHEGSDGSTPSERIVAAGYVGRASGENVLCGDVTPERAVEMWLGSPPHRANILSSAFEDVGVGVDVQTQNGTTWTLTFGAGDSP